MPGMSREECCRSGRLGTSWTEEDVPNSTLFRWMIFNGGAPNCIPCKGTIPSVLNEIKQSNYYITKYLLLQSNHINKSKA